MDATVRDLLLKQMQEDLVGPLAEDELLEDRPSDRYMTGILFPQRARLPEEEDEELRGGEDDAEEATDTAPDSVPLNNTLRPASAGLSFAAKADGERPSVRIHISCGTYEPLWLDKDGKPAKEPGPDYEARWRRHGHAVDLSEVALNVGVLAPITLEPHGIPGLEVRIVVADGPHCTTVTAVLVNTLEAGETRLENEQRTFFQVELRIRPGGRTELVSRPSRKSGEEPEFQLIYRACREYAAGHTCSVRWDTVSSGHVGEVATSWIPSRDVPAVSGAGDDCFAALRDDPALRPLSAEWLATASESQLTAGLSLLPSAYEAWLDQRTTEIAQLPRELQPQAKVHISRCREAAARMRGAITLFTRDAKALMAFRFANRAMAIQRRWSRGESDLTWRPFQLGFQLLTLESLANPLHADRNTMDLLWFPTGGGKTEAYLGLVAFVLFYRRLSETDPAAGAGTSVIMRYTLRLLTIQQFQRAAALICASEYMRRGHECPTESRPRFGEQPFSIGLWVGGGATPNSVKEAADRLGANDDPTPCQLKACPACRQESLEWTCVYARGRRGDRPERIHVQCTNASCPLGGPGAAPLPVWTVDEDVYREAPSLLIGTVDKFAQIARKPGETSVFFGGAGVPPTLIIQDELHLISGPLGTIAGLYEIAIDELCAREVDRDGERVKTLPKIIGSTATIRRASDQITALFNRATFQFPPPALDAQNSCFAVRDVERPGRLYVGVTSAGRSPKFALQATCGTLLQAAADPAIVPDHARDPWWTLIVYFNSLRELGGALVMMQDDVPASIRLYASTRARAEREVASLDELTSRKRQVELRDTLHDLEKTYGSDAFDAVLATNMISVGVDVPRLSLMVVNGQPKQIAEYIQATSRVGREYPGLIVTVYNAGRARDRSHYETFPSWHAAPYRDVEATSVTPFASRAQDKAIHAVLVALVRHKLVALRERPVLTTSLRQQIERHILPLIDSRVAAVDPEEAAGVRAKLRELLDVWEMRCARWSAGADQPSYWWDQRPDRSLLMSAEQYAARAAAGYANAEVWSTPNSMRDVEPGSPFRLISKLSTSGGPASAGGAE